MLDVVRPQTGERLHVMYWIDGALQQREYEQLCTLMRDVHVDESTRIDPFVLDTLWASQFFMNRAGVDRPLEILSGYRTPGTNAKVGGAQRSLHMEGRAVDYRIPGLSPAQLGELVRGFRSGGVGFYTRPSRNGGWVHADTGDFRSWRG